MEVKATLRGGEEVINRIQGFNNIAENELGMAMLEVVNNFVTDAKSFAPLDTGYLREHITGRVIGKYRGLMIVGRVTSSARYSIYQEFGTSHHAAHPYMVTAYNKNKWDILEKFGKALDTAIHKAAVGKYYGGGAIYNNAPTGMLEREL